MKFRIKYTNAFKKDYERIKKRGYDVQHLQNVVALLASGTYQGFYDCHISSDWIMIYKIDLNEIVLVLSRTGTHSNLFR